MSNLDKTTYQITFLTVGLKAIPMRVIALKTNTFVTFKGAKDFFLCPVFNLRVTETKGNRRKVTMEAYLDHKSTLFQVIFGPYTIYIIQF